MASALVIGIGSTGFDVIEQALHYYYEFTKKEKPEHTEFMFLETARKSSPNIDKGVLSFCDISTDNISATLHAWHEDENVNHPWIPQEADVLNAHNGAGGQPVYGRLGLWANEVAVRAKIRQLYSKVGGDQHTNIYIVGSLVGGTGSGVCLDIACMVRETTNNDNIWGMFLLPNRVDIGDKTKQSGYENAYSSLKVIDYFSKSNDGKWYECTMPSGNNISRMGAPYKQAQFFTQDFDDSSAQMPTLDNLIQSVGFNLVLRVIDIDNVVAPFQQRVLDRLVDFSNVVPDGIFSTIGLNVFQYPEGLLEEYFATEQLKKSLLDRWMDPVHYISKSGQSASVEGLTLSELKPKVNKRLQNIVKQAVDSCRATPILGKKNLKAALENEVANLLEKSYAADFLDEDAFLYDLFDANNSTKYYAAIKGKSIDLRNAIVTGIADFVNEMSLEYQNLHVMSNLIQHIADAATDMTKSWNMRYGIDGKADGWNNYWANHLLSERLHQGRFWYGITGCKADYYYEALDGVVQLCYFNVLFDVLDQVANSMSSKPGVNALTAPCPDAKVDKRNILLPTKRNVEEMFDKVKKLLDEKNDNSIMNRHETIAGQLNGNGNTQINFLYQSGSFEDDVKTAQGRYQNDAKTLNFRHLSGLSVWEYLRDNNVLELKNNMIEKALGFVQELNLFSDCDIVEIMKNLQPNDAKYPKVHSLLTDTAEDIRNTVPAMCALVKNKSFGDHDKLKLIVASNSDDNNDSGIVNAMGGYKPSKTSSNYVYLPSMKNTVVVYQEYCYMGMVNGHSNVFNPLTDIGYQSQVRGAIDQKGNSYNDTGLRLAYLDLKETLNDESIKIK